MIEIRKNNRLNIHKHLKDVKSDFLITEEGVYIFKGGYADSELFFDFGLKEASLNAQNTNSFTQRMNINSISLHNYINRNLKEKTKALNNFYGKMVILHKFLNHFLAIIEKVNESYYLDSKLNLITNYNSFVRIISQEGKLQFELSSCQEVFVMTFGKGDINKVNIQILEKMRDLSDYLIKKIDKIALDYHDDKLLSSIKDKLSKIEDYQFIYKKNK